MVSGSVHIGGSARQTASAPAGHAFPRTAKLLRHPLFDQVYRCGQRHFSGLMTVFFLLRKPEELTLTSRHGEITGPRIGFTVGRVLGPSVERNRIRRRMREAVRLNLDRLTRPVDVVINPKKIVLQAEFPKLVEEVQRAFAAVEKKASSSGDVGSPRADDSRARSRTNRRS